MSASNNFITRPVLSTVCSLLIVIVGLIAILILPILGFLAWLVAGPRGRAIRP